MFTVIALMLTGMCVGYLLRKKRLGRIQQLITLLIWMLLFILGIEVGSNEQIIRGLHTIGLEALLLTLGGTLGSVIAAWTLWRMLYPQKRKGAAATENETETGKGNTDKSMADARNGNPNEGTANARNGNASGMEAESTPGGWQALKGSLVIVGFFALGTLVGVLHMLPFHIEETDISFYALCALMCSVGLSVSNDPQTLKNFRSLNPRLVFLPVMTIAGTLAGSAIISLLLQERSLTDCLAVGSGFGYYSLSSIFITEYKGAELGTIALLANICREILTLLAAPLMVRWFGNLAPIAAGGATTMDTTLPVITRAAGQEFVVVSIFHGFVVDFSVPFLVTFFCSI